MSDYVIDWGTVGNNGQTTTLQNGTDTLDVTVSTPENIDHQEFDASHLDGKTILKAQCVEEPVKTVITFGEPVSNLSFDLIDVDQGHGWDDKVTIIARDADGNIVPVTFSGLTHHDVDGNTVEGGGSSNADLSLSSSDNVHVSIAGPIASLEIVLDDGASDDDSGAVGIGHISFDAAPVGDGYVDGTDAGETIDAAFVDVDGDRVDANDEILPGEGPQDDVILAGGGNDTVYAADGNDEVFAGTGDDIVHGQAGNDYLNGGAGNDMLFGGSGDDGIVGGAGNDKVEASQGEDAIAGGDGNDDLWAGKDDDVVSGGRGHDDIDAAEGDDLIFGGQGADTITGGDGNDTISGGSQEINENIDFNDLAAGDLVTTQFVDKGFTVTSGDPTTPVMVFDTDNPTGGDGDLATNNLGNVLILSEDRDPTDPDDNASGGEFIFDFENPATIVNIGLLDIEAGATITLTFEDGSTQDVSVPATANNGQVTQWLNADGVMQMTVSMPNSGAIDNLCFSMDADAGDGDDVIDAGDGDDTVFGNAGDDTITGGAGDDTLVGGDDADTIFGGAGDTVDGSEGGNDHDTLDLTGQGPIRVIYDQSNDENGTVEFLDDHGNVSGTLTFTNIENVVGDIQPGSDGIVEGDDAANTIDVNYAGDPDGDFVDAGDAVLPGEAPNDDIIIAGGGNDNVTAGAGDDDVLGGAGDDILRGNEGNDYLDGNVGDDMIFGGSGDDRISGGDGDDKIEASSGNDAIAGGAGKDDIWAGKDDDIVDAGDGNDTVNAGSGDDIVYGGAGADEIKGGSGDDVLLGGGTGTPGDNLILNGSFEDTTGMTQTSYGFVGTGSVPNWVETNGPDNEIDFHNNDRGGVEPTDGNNWLDLEASPGETRVGQAVAGVTTGEIYTLTFDAGDAPDENNVVNVYWGGELIGTLSPEDGQMDSYQFVVEGGAGDGSNLLEFEGVATLGNGNVGAAIDNVVLVASGDASDTSDDTIFGEEGDDFIDGQGGNDTLSGGSGDDTIAGGDGNDTITGGDGSDTVTGGDGNDVINTSGGAPLLDLGFPGYPSEGVPPIPADFDPNNDVDFVDGGDGDDIIITGDDADTILGGDGNDIIDAGIDADDVKGGDGDDRIVGGEGSDTIDGGEGDDIIYAGIDPDLGLPDDLDIPDSGANQPADPEQNNGKDVVNGGEGNDTIFGQDDDDTLFGDAGNDFIDGGIDDDTISGGSGDDTIIGGEGADTQTGNSGEDTFLVGSAEEGIGDVIDGGQAASGPDDEIDTLDLTGSGNIKIIYTSPDQEDGIVQFRDDNDAVTGTLTFTEIENVIPCFTPGTTIATPKGERLVEELKVGDKIITRDNGLQEIRWLGAKKLDWKMLTGNPHLKPILIRAGALGNGLPERDMLVSPNHRVLVSNDRTALYFEEREVLAAAKHLVNNNGIHEVDTMGTSYIHFMFDQHEVVLSNGSWTESFQPGDYTLKGIGNAQRNEIFELFPELQKAEGVAEYRAARKTLKKHEAKLLLG